jgi:hypothetical protein
MERRAQDTNWIRVGQEVVDLPREEKHGPVTITYSLSPFDVLTGIRSKFDRDQGLVIDFKYLDSEEHKLITYGDVTYRIGINSDRLYGMNIQRTQILEPKVGTAGDFTVEFDTLSSKATAAILKGFENLPLEGLKPERLESYEAAKKAVLENKDTVLSVLRSEA